MDALLSELLEHEGELDGLTSRLQALDLPRRGTPVPPSLRQSIVDLLEACQSAAAHCAATLNAACSFMVLPPELLVLVMQECDSIALSRLAQTAKFLTTCATPSPINSAADAAAKSLFGPALVKLPPKQFSPVMRLRWLERTKLVAAQWALSLNGSPIGFWPPPIFDGCMSADYVVAVVRLSREAAVVGELSGSNAWAFCRRCAVMLMAKMGSTRRVQFPLNAAINQMPEGAPPPRELTASVVDWLMEVAPEMDQYEMSVLCEEIVYNNLCYDFAHSSPHLREDWVEMESGSDDEELEYYNLYEKMAPLLRVMLAMIQTTLPQEQPAGWNRLFQHKLCLGSLLAAASRFEREPRALVTMYEIGSTPDSDLARESVELLSSALRDASEIFGMGVPVIKKLTRALCWAHLQRGQYTEAKDVIMPLLEHLRSTASYDDEAKYFLLKPMTYLTYYYAYTVDPNIAEGKLRQSKARQGKDMLDRPLLEEAERLISAHLNAMRDSNYKQWEIADMTNKLVDLQRRLGKTGDAMRSLAIKMSMDPNNLKDDCMLVELLSEHGDAQGAQERAETAAATFHERLNSTPLESMYKVFGPFHLVAARWNEEHRYDDSHGMRVEFIKSWRLLDQLIEAQRQVVASLEESQTQRGLHAMGLLVTWLIAGEQKEEARALLVRMNAESDAVHGVCSKTSHEIFEELQTLLENQSPNDHREHVNRITARLNMVRAADQTSEAGVKERHDRVSHLQIKLRSQLTRERDSEAIEALARSALEDARTRSDFESKMWTQVLAQELLRQERFDDAATVLVEELARHENDHDASPNSILDLRVQLGLAYQDTGELDEARRILRSVVDPMRAEEARAKEDSYRGLRRAYCSLIDDAQCALGQILLTQGGESEEMHMVEEAAALFKALSEKATVCMYRNGGDALVLLGDALERLGRHDEAAVAWDEARSLGLLPEFDDDEGGGEGGEGGEETAGDD